MKSSPCIVRCLLFAASCIGAQCSVSHVAGGGTIETTNGAVAGVIVLSSGGPGAGTQVRLLPSDFDPVKDIPATAPDTADSMGRYGFTKLPYGDYVVTAVNAAEGTRSIIAGIHVADLAVTVMTDTLRLPGTIKIALPPGVSGLTGYVYVPGTAVAVFLNNRVDFATIDSAPASVIPRIMYSSANDSAATTIRYDVTVRSGDTARVFNPMWKHARALILNTSASGAGMASPVVNFPVLVRLTADNFDFSQAGVAGADLRFTNSDNSFLPHEIERWDRANRRAEIWVRLDTVRGSDCAQFIRMYWGNPDAPGVSNGAAVFDSAAGFIAAWHLDGNCLNANGRGRDGVNYGSRDTGGIIGAAKKFSGNDSIKIAGLLGAPATLTLSAWVKTDTTEASGQDIISLGDAVLIREDEVVNAYGTSGYAHQYTRNGDTAFTKVTSGLNIAKTGWRYIAFTFDNEAQVHSLYIDGAAVRVDSSAYPIDYTGVGVNTFIGAHGNNKKLYNNRGLIDEVRVCGVARSGDWIRLCFMNQRTDDKLVAFK